MLNVFIKNVSIILLMYKKKKFNLIIIRNTVNSGLSGKGLRNSILVITDIDVAVFIT